MATVDPVRSLAQLGFTHLEAEIYTFLVGEPLATGYRIAQAIGKPAANTYKAIQSLERKGAVVVEEGVSRLCKAVPAEELLGRVGREFEAHREAAIEALKRLHEPRIDDRVYQIRSWEAMVERARQMLDSAQRIALLEIPIALSETLEPSLAGASGRGVDTLALTHALDGTGAAEVVHSEQDSPIFRVVVDAQQHLMAELGDAGALVHAVWSESRFLSESHHRGLAAEINHRQLEVRIRDDAGQKRLLRTLAQLRLTGTAEHAS